MRIAPMTFVSCGLAALILASSTASGLTAATQPAETPNSLSPEEKTAGFRMLFNGKDLSGWKPNGKPGSFTVKDGVILGDRTGHSDLAYWLGTEREYDNFELRLQYRIGEGGNSGVFLRAPHDGRTSKMGMEIQILDDGARKGKPGVGDTGGVYRVVAPRAFVSKPAGQWNDLWILCDGDRVRVTLNGQVITDARMKDYPDLDSRPRKGFIGLSAHTKPAQFRSIRLREIPRGAATSTSPGAVSDVR